MKDDRNLGSVLMLPPDDDERALLEHVRDRLQVDPASRERLRSRLEGIDDLTIQRFLRDARLRSAARALAVAAALVLAVVSGRWALQGWMGAPSELPPTMVVMTDSGQTQTVTPVSGIDVEVRSETHLTVLPGDPEGVLLVLADGDVVVDHRRGPGGPPLAVQAGEVQVRVTGTRFTVSRAGDLVTVSVDRGSVAVAWPGGEADLGAGGTWRSWGEPEVLITEFTIDPVDSATELLDPVELLVVPEAPEQVPVPPPVVAIDESPVALATADSAVPDEATLYARIQLERGAGVPAADRLVDLEAFLSAYPDSPFGEEVRALQIEALADTGQDHAALAAAGSFCDRHGEGPRRRQVRWIEARVAHGRLGDCGRALPAYRELAAGTGPRVGEAMYGLGVCAFETGRSQEARDALEAATAFDLDPVRAEHARRLLESL